MAEEAINPPEEQTESSAPVDDMSQEDSPLDLVDLEPSVEDGASDVPLVLVIDDDKVFRKTLDYVLQRKGEFRVLLAEDGEVGVELALKHKPDLVCDVMMRGMHGYATVSALRTHSITKETPVVMVTGQGSALGERRAKVHGADYYLKKPFKLPELLKTIRSALAKRSDARGVSGWSSDVILLD